MKSNLEYLNDDLKYLGFGENTLLNRQLEESVANGKPEFELYTDAFFEHFIRTEAKLHFLKLVNKGTYVFDRFTATNQYEQDPGKNKEREFHVYKGVGVTFKEAFNLLDGRAAMIDGVDQDDKVYRTWVQLDFEERDAHLNYRFKYFRHYELERVLESYPIEELLADATRKTLLASLERGNKCLITLNTGKPEPKWIEANPAEKTIRIYTPESPLKKRASDGRRPAARRARTMSDPTNPPDPTGEKAAEDQELSEESTTVTGK
ncbi:MAG TPA: hypothetical protein VNV35_17320 [Puia sp.]|jgi:hypothetical protein|nr:hypothetical protein [Puia sp.]